MKKEIIGADGKVKTWNIRNELHFQTQLNTRMQIRRNRKKYTRKIKHKRADGN